jgi:hypothetical protein
LSNKPFHVTTDPIDHDFFPAERIVSALPPPKDSEITELTRSLTAEVPNGIIGEVTDFGLLIAWYARLTGTTNLGK